MPIIDSNKPKPASQRKNYFPIKFKQLLSIRQEKTPKGCKKKKKFTEENDKLSRKEEIGIFSALRRQKKFPQLC